MSERHSITLTLNGRSVSAEVDARTHLADFLRHQLKLTGTHVGCEHGVCGACNIMLDGRSARSCLMLAVQADGAVIDTVEGLTASGLIADLQQEFVARNALQCGYCTPGVLMTATELLSRVKSRANPSRAEIRDALSGNYCRCTGYHTIVDAIEAVIQRRAGAIS